MHRRPQPDPRQRPRTGRHAPDRPQEPRHLRPLQHHPRAGTARGRRPAGRLSGAARTGDAAWRAASPGPHRRPAPSPRATGLRGPDRRTPGLRPQTGGGGRRTPPVCAPRLASRPQVYEPASDHGTRGDVAGRRGQPRARAGPDRASRPGGPEAPLLFSEIRNLIFWGAVHPASHGEYENGQRVRPVLRRR